MMTMKMMVEEEGEASGDNVRNDLALTGALAFQYSINSSRLLFYEKLYRITD